MPLTNSYVTLDEFLALPELNQAAPVDDVFVERLLERCSREWDGDTGHWFYASPQTRVYDLPHGRCLELDAPLLSVDAITNGDDTTLETSLYNLYPLNGPHKTEIRIKQSSNVTWRFPGSGDTEGVIQVRGTWGYVDRSATDPESLMAILNSKSAVLMLALALYKKRYGVGVDGVAQVTGAGVVITPRDKSNEYWALVEIYRRHL